MEEKQERERPVITPTQTYKGTVVEVHSGDCLSVLSAPSGKDKGGVV